MGPAAIDASGPELSEAILGSGIVQNTECDHAGQQHFDNRFVLSTTDANHLIYTKGTQQQTDQGEQRRPRSLGSETGLGTGVAGTGIRMVLLRIQLSHLSSSFTFTRRPTAA